jgi:hypothetical protein
MARTTKSDILIPELFVEAVQGAFAQRDAFAGASMLARTGAVVTNDSFSGDRNAIGNQVEVPYFGILGEFTPNADGTAVTPGKVSQTSEKATVSRDSLAFEVTRWGQNAKGADTYAEAARQIVVAAARAMDKRLVDECVAPANGGGLVKAAYNATTPVYLDYDLMTDAKMLWGDEQDDIVGMVVHSTTFSDLYKLRDANGRPLISDPADGELPRFMGLPISVSDRLPTTGSSTSAVTSAGTSPPAVTLSGTPLGAFSLKIILTVGGLSNGTAKFKFSLDGGSTYSAELTVPNGGGAIALTDTAVDSLVGVSGASGLTATFANGTYNVDNTYIATAKLKIRTVLLKRAALGFWYNRQALTLQTDKDVLMDSSIGAMHLYAAAIRYRRRNGGVKPGAVLIEHNVRGWI